MSKVVLQLTRSSEDPLREPQESRKKPREEGATMPQRPKSGLTNQCSWTTPLVGPTGWCEAWGHSGFRFHSSFRVAMQSCCLLSVLTESTFWLNEGKIKWCRHSMLSLAISWTEGENGFHLASIVPFIKPRWEQRPVSHKFLTSEKLSVKVLTCDRQRWINPRPGFSFPKGSIWIWFPISRVCSFLEMNNPYFVNNSGPR